MGRSLYQYSGALILCTLPLWAVAQDLVELSKYQIAAPDDRVIYQLAIRNTTSEPLYDVTVVSSAVASSVYRAVMQPGQLVAVLAEVYSEGLDLAAPIVWNISFVDTSGQLNTTTLK